jgi:hypothetical protein
MIHLHAGFNKLTSEIITNPFKVKVQSFVHLISEDLFSVFAYKDQMQVKRICNVSFGS